MLASRARSRVVVGVVLLCLWIALGVTVATGQTRSESPAGRSAPPAGRSESPAGTLTWGVHVTLAARWLDPSDTEAFITPFMVLYAIHDALVKPMPPGPGATAASADNTPSLAESWTVSKDGLTYEFVLRRGVKFHNGDPVTADDVKFSFDRYHGAAAKLLKDRVREVQIVDPGRVRFHLKEPWPDFMTFYGTSATGAAWIVPRKYVEKVGEDGFKKAPVGAGPYRFVSFTPGIELVMEAFEGYWRKTPSVKRLVFRSMPDETTRAAALKSGDVDIVYLLSGPTAEDVKRTRGLRLAAAKPPGVVFLDLPEQWDPKSPWHDRRVRLAASLALDRNALNQAETLGLSHPTGALIPRVLEFSRTFEPPAHDPVRARQLLAEAGYPSGFDAGDLTPFPPFFSLAEAVGNDLQTVGIRTRMRTMERAAFLTAWREKKLKGVIMGLGAPAGNAATRIEVYVTKNGIYSSGVVPEIEDLFQRQGRELDRKKREAMLHQIQQIMSDRVMHVPIYELAFLWGIGPRVEEACVDWIKGFSYSAPYEDLKLKASRQSAMPHRIPLVMSLTSP
jgi:peptide/nickel transport system substrate-binding protein